MSKPSQLPHPPLFTTLTQSPATLEWVARVGSSIVTLASDNDMLRGLFQRYVEVAAEYGRDFKVGEWRPDSVGEQVQTLRRELDVDYIVFVACAGAVDHQLMLDTIQLFGENVIPAV